MTVAQSFNQIHARHTRKQVGDDLPPARSALDHAADLLSEADPSKFPTRAHGLRYLLATRPGAPLMRRVGEHLHLRTASKATRTAPVASPEPAAEQSTDAARRVINTITEAAFTKIVCEFAREKYPNDTPAKAFQKTYEECSEQGAAIR